MHSTILFLMLTKGSAEESISERNVPITLLSNLDREAKLGRASFHVSEYNVAGPQQCLMQNQPPDHIARSPIIPIHPSVKDNEKFPRVPYTFCTTKDGPCTFGDLQSCGMFTMGIWWVMCA